MKNDVFLHQCGEDSKETRSHFTTVLFLWAKENSKATAPN